jgi:hypothetical protein
MRTRVISPELRDGQLLWRLVGGTEVKAGRLSKKIASTFDVPLARWRDAFGPSRGGCVQFRVAGWWVDFATLRSESVEAFSFPGETAPPALPGPSLEAIEAAGSGDRVDSMGLTPAQRKGEVAAASVLVDRRVSLACEDRLLRWLEKVAGSLACVDGRLDLIDEEGPTNC